MDQVLGASTPRRELGFLCGVWNGCLLLARQPSVGLGNINRDGFISVLGTPGVRCPVRFPVGGGSAFS